MEAKISGKPKAAAKKATGKKAGVQGSPKKTPSRKDGRLLKRPGKGSLAKLPTSAKRAKRPGTIKSAFADQLRVSRDSVRLYEALEILSGGSDGVAERWLATPN